MHVPRNNNPIAYFGIGLVLLICSLPLQWVRVLEWNPRNYGQLITVGSVNGWDALLFDGQAGLLVPAWLLALAGGLALLLAIFNAMRLTRVPVGIILLPGILAVAGLLYLTGSLCLAEKLQPGIGPFMALAGIMLPAIPRVTGNQEPLFHHAPPRR